MRSKKGNVEIVLKRSLLIVFIKPSTDILSLIVGNVLLLFKEAEPTRRKWKGFPIFSLNAISAIEYIEFPLAISAQNLVRNKNHLPNTCILIVDIMQNK